MSDKTNAGDVLAVLTRDAEHAASWRVVMMERALRIKFSVESADARTAVAAIIAERDALREALNILHAHDDDPAVWAKVDAILARCKGGA